MNNIEAETLINKLLSFKNIIPIEIYNDILVAIYTAEKYTEDNRMYNKHFYRDINHKDYIILDENNSKKYDIYLNSILKETDYDLDEFMKWYEAYSRYKACILVQDTNNLKALHLIEPK